jgi:hypothetical protein
VSSKPNSVISGPWATNRMAGKVWVTFYFHVWAISARRRGMSPTRRMRFAAA